MKQTENRILLAIDFQNQSLIGFEYAVEIAKLTKSELHLLHVIEDGNFIARMVNSDEQKRKIIEESKKLMDNLVNNVGGSLKIVQHIEEGKVYEQIELLSERIKPKFIMMGKTEQSNLSRRIVGSNSLHLIKEAIFPVMTVRDSSAAFCSETERKILLPLDLTGEICEQITAAIEYSKFFNTAIHVISVLNKNSIGLELQLTTRLNKVKNILAESGINCTSELIKATGKPIDEVIVEESSKTGICMIIIMTQNEADIVKYFLGSTAQEVILKSPKPVLSIIPWERNEQSVFNNFIDPLGILK